jgi:hypothetical protein
MPRPRPPPSLEGITQDQLMLAVLAVLDAHRLGPEFRKRMHTQLGACLEASGGARKVLAEAIAIIRSRPR